MTAKQDETPNRRHFYSQLVVPRIGLDSTHRGVDGRVSLKLAVVVDTMVSLAEGDAREAASDGACSMSE
jgi:hypothetical protein